ncbi:excalibur calcium-binding domain-containing protein [Psychrobacillus sp. FSL W7-1457]|uniref:excalibur calcium-binding domain-containing protein n=1 Tax=Psychrobacillus sp. FSL W7-1457 TaxID=2954547 RepID=UPI00315A453F
MYRAQCLIQSILILNWLQTSITRRNKTCGNSSNEATSTPVKTGFKNCTELKKVYPNGVSSDHPVYLQKFDRDKEGWGCDRFFFYLIKKFIALTL